MTDPPHSESISTVSLRDIAKAKGPDDRDVEFQRQITRRKYVDALFKSDDVSRKSRAQTLNALSTLWLETTHTIIHAYRERLSQMDKAIAANTPRDPAKGKPETPAPGPTARRRLVQKFRGFLTAEESFWSELLARIADVFDVHDALPILRVLTIPEYGKNAIKINMTPSSAKEMFYKALIYYGDLERYRGVWAENTAPLGKNKRGAPKKDKKRNVAQLSYHSSRASEAYYQARLLLPEDGNAIHQLAVLSQTQEDTLSSVYWFFRSLSVQKPFSAGKANLHRCLGLALGRMRPRETGENDPELLKHDFIQLLGLIFLHKKIESVPKRIESVAERFSKVILDRSIANDVILKMIVMSISAWWSCRDGSKAPPRGTTEKTENIQNEDNLQWTNLAFENMLQIICTLITSSSVEDIAIEIDGGTDLGQTVSAILRRCLPSIRICFQLISRNLDRFVNAPTTAIDTLLNVIATFGNKLLKAFPPDQLASYQNSGDIVLEENFDLKGFAPLSKRGNEKYTSEGNQRQVHPNEEQLLRICDIINAAMLISSSENSRLTYDGSFFSVPAVSTIASEPALKPATEPIPSHAAITADIFEDSAELDPVEMAMRAGTSNILEEETDDEDQVLYEATVLPQEMLQLNDHVPHSPTKASTASDVLLQLLKGDVQGGEMTMDGSGIQRDRSGSGLISPNGGVRSIWASVPGEPTYNPTSPPFTAPHYSHGVGLDDLGSGSNHLAEYPLFPLSKPASISLGSRPGSAAIDAYHNLSREVSAAASMYSPNSMSPVAPGTPYAEMNNRNMVVDSFNALPNHTRPFDPYEPQQQPQPLPHPHQHQPQLTNIQPHLTNMMSTFSPFTTTPTATTTTTTTSPPPGLGGPQTYLDDQLK